MLILKVKRRDVPQTSKQNHEGAAEWPLRGIMPCVPHRDNLSKAQGADRRYQGGPGTLCSNILQGERDTWAAFQRWGCDWGVMVSMVPFARARSRELICIQHTSQSCELPREAE